MNLQDQIGVLEAGVDQLIKAAAAAQALLADERAAAEPCQVSPVAAGEVQTVEAQTIDADIAAVAHVAAAPVAAEQPQVEATEVVEAAETIETAESVNAVEIAEPALGNTAGDGVRYGACGILGGRDGLPHRYTLYSTGSEPRPIRTKEVGIVIRPGDRLVLESGGGGGWGDPALRTAENRRCDLETGFVTRQAASGETGAAGPCPSVE